MPTIRPKTTGKNNQQAANISGTFKPPPRATGQKDHRDVNKSILSKWELRKTKNIETQSSEIRSTSQQSFSQQTANSVCDAKQFAKWIGSEVCGEIATKTQRPAEPPIHCKIKVPEPRSTVLSSHVKPHQLQITKQFKVLRRTNLPPMNVIGHLSDFQRLLPLHQCTGTVFAPGIAVQEPGLLLHRGLP